MSPKYPPDIPTFNITVQQCIRIKDYIYNLAAFLNTNDKNIDKETRTTILFPIVSKNKTKYLRLNVTKVVKAVQ